MILVSISLQQCSFDLSVFFYPHFSHITEVFPAAHKICDFFDIVDFNIEVPCSVLLLWPNEIT